MSNKIAASLLGAAILFFSIALYNSTRVSTSSPRDYAFDYVCQALEADCSELEAPTLRFGPYNRLTGSLGFYWESRSPNSIYMDLHYEPTLKSGKTSIDPMAWSILVHETTHYVDKKLGITSGESCAVESLGWHVGNTWLLEHNHYDLVNWDWYANYSQCSGPTS